MALNHSIISSLNEDELHFIRKEIERTQPPCVQTLFNITGQGAGPDNAQVALERENGNTASAALRKALLVATEQYHAAAYTEAALNSLITQIKIFAEKHCFDVVKTLFEEGLTLAEENELFSQWMELLELKINFIQTRNYPPDQAPEYLLVKLQTVFGQFQNLMAYRFLLMEQMQLANKSFLLRNGSDLQNWGDVFRHDLLSSPDKALSTKALLDYWTIKAQYYIVTNQHAKAADCYKEILEVFEHHPVFKKLRSQYYIWANSQLAHLAYDIKDAGTLRRCIDALATIKSSNEEERESLFTYYIENSLQYYALTEDNESLRKLLVEAREGLRFWKEKMRLEHLMALIYGCIGTWNELGEYENALALTCEFREYIHADYRLDIKLLILFSELIARIESGDYDIVDGALKSFNQFLLRNDLKSEFEQLMLRFLNIIAAPCEDSFEELRAIKQELTKIPGKSILNQHMVLYPSLMDMIDSRLAGKKYHEYVKTAKAA